MGSKSITIDNDWYALVEKVTRNSKPWCGSPKLDNFYKIAEKEIGYKVYDELPVSNSIQFLIIRFVLYFILFSLLY